MERTHEIGTGKSIGNIISLSRNMENSELEVAINENVNGRFKDTIVLWKRPERIEH